MKPFLIFSLLAIILLSGCQQESNSNEATDQSNEIESLVPEWSKEVIWYQIFVERFRNGDPSNDPTREDIWGNGPEAPEDWSVTSWDHDWYEREPWLDKVESDNFYGKIQLRRFGGDLQGVLDQMDYLEDLGVNAIYFNPLNDAPSLHKYDARNYRHIDRNFGPDPKGDKAIMDAETPDDPSTWKMTAADTLFLHIVEELHERGIRVILDYSWNHTGTDFWALNDLRENGENSRFKDWYNVLSYDDPNTPEDEFDFEGWAGYKGLPVFSKIIVPEDDNHMPFEGNLASASLKEHIFNVTRKWLDPNGDGDPSDGIDGYRLDVAGEVPQDFWREYRKVVKEVNPDAYLVGEIWWDRWPDTLMDPRGFLEGDQYDAIMNYRWYRVARRFFAQAGLSTTPSKFIEEMEEVNRDISDDHLKAMMNMTSSHDAPRLSTSLYNKQKYKYQVKPNDDPNYKINKPDELTLKEQKLLLIHQFTFIGAPQIWNGDEVGMWGADDPDCRKPMVWSDLTYKDEVAHYNPEITRSPEPVSVDQDLLSFYKQLIRFRKENPVLSHGDYEFVHHSDDNFTLAYTRSLGEDYILTAFNRSDQSQELEINLEFDANFKNGLDPSVNFTAENNLLKLTLEPLEAVVLIRE